MAVRQFKLKCYPNLPAPSYKLQLPLIPNIIQPIKSAKKGCRSIYQFLAKENLETPTSHVKWENEIQLNNNFSWQHIHQLPFKCCLSTSTQWFQYRLCHRILATNYLLQKIGIKDSNICSFCKNEPETLCHLFYNCPMVFDFWNELKQWLQSKCNHLDNVIFSKTDIMLGITTQNKVDLTLNFILLNTKQFRNCIKTLSDFSRFG